jgi:hypothetical protein
MARSVVRSSLRTFRSCKSNPAFLRILPRCPLVRTQPSWPPVNFCKSAQDRSKLFRESVALGSLVAAYDSPRTRHRAFVPWLRVQNLSIISAFPLNIENPLTAALVWVMRIEPIFELLEVQGGL